MANYNYVIAALCTLELKCTTLLTSHAQLFVALCYTASAVSVKGVLVS